MRAAPASFVLLLLLSAIFAGCLDGDRASHKSEPTKLSGKQATPAVYPGTYKFDGAYSQVLAEGPYAAKPPVKLLIKSKTGQDVEIGYHLPDVPEGQKVPVIVVASPYHRGARSIPTIAGQTLFLHDNFLPHGYAIAMVSVRGTGNSGGCMDLMGPKEVADLDSAITWLGTQPWSNGNVAMIGVSYDGSTPWSVAATGNPHLKTIVPISGLPDIFPLSFRNGSSEQRAIIAINAGYYQYGWDISDRNRSPDHVVEGLVCPESFVGFATAPYSAVVGERDAMGWWQERNRKPAIEKNYKGSILLVQGLQDWNVDPSLVLPWTDQLNKTGIPVKQLLGQWGHAPPDRVIRAGEPAPTTRFDWAEILLHWFDYWLKDQKQVELGPSVQVQDQSMLWRNEETWPPRDANWTAKHLGSEGKLLDVAGAAGSVLLTPAPLLAPAQPYFRSFPTFAADFQMVAPDDGLRISGLPRLHVTVSPKGPTGHLAAWLYTVDQGQETRVGWTQMNLRFADGTEKQKPIVPNAPLLAKMEFQPLDVYIKPGQILRLRIWEYTENDRIPAVPPQPVEVLWGGSTRSVLELPIVHPQPEDFFQPPMPK